MTYTRIEHVRFGENTAWAMFFYYTSKHLVFRFDTSKLEKGKKGGPAAVRKEKGTDNSQKLGTQDYNPRQQFSMSVI